MGQILRARKSFAVGNKIVKRGTLVDSAAPLVAGREALFEAVESAVEQATAAPGERRSVKKAAAKKAAPSRD